MKSKIDAILSRVEQRRVLCGHDILDLRREVFGDNYVAWNEADRLFTINAMDIEKAAGWDEFFVAVMTAFLVRQSKPSGFVDQAAAEWFIERAAPSGHIETSTDLKVLQAVLTEARDATETFVDFALEQVKGAILHGHGQIGRNRSAKPKTLTRSDVEMIEKILYASGGDGHVAVSEKEAEMLFDINDACTPDDDTVETWQSLFVNGITNSVMFCSVANTPNRSEVKRQQGWASARGDLNVAGSMNTLTPQNVWDSFSGKDLKEQSQRYLIDQEIVARSERIDEGEALWLARRIARDGILSVNERALLKHLGKMCPDIHPSLTPFIKAA